jgi:hypothetical protein
MGERTLNWPCDQRTLAFYGTLVAMVILDLILLFWVFNPFSHFGTATTPAREVPIVSDVKKPSPFDSAKAAPAKRMKTTPAQARAAAPAVLNASF